MAEQILDDYGIKNGLCLDIGSGHGYLGIEIAKRSNLLVHCIDIDIAKAKLCQTNARRSHIERQVTAMCMDVADMSFDQNYADLIVSRGSMWFWEDNPKAFREIYRVLKPGGIGLIGGGLGRNLPPEYREPLEKERQKNRRDPNWMKMRSKAFFTQILQKADINHYHLLHDPPTGRWVEVRKP